MNCKRLVQHFSKLLRQSLATEVTGDDSAFLVNKHRCRNSTDTIEVSTFTIPVLQVGKLRP